MFLGALVLFFKRRENNFPRQIEDKRQCDDSRISTAEDVQSPHTRVLKGRSISTTTPRDSALRGKYWKWDQTKRLFRE